MKVEVVQVFIDREGKQHEIGEFLEIADETRIPNLLNKGLIKVDEKAEEKPKKTTARKKKVKDDNAGKN